MAYSLFCARAKEEIMTPQERISSALPFGRVIHSILETYYRGIKDAGEPPLLEKLLTLFEEGLVYQIESSSIPVIYKKEAPDLGSLLVMGENLIQTFYENVDLEGCEIMGIELPLSTPLISEDKTLRSVGNSGDQNSHAASIFL